MNLFTRPAPTIDPAANRERADELRRRVTSTVRVPPPADSDVPGCWACGIGEVKVSGGRAFESHGVRRDRVCMVCRGSGSFNGMDCPECRGGAHEPCDTVEVKHDVTRTVEARDMDHDDLARRLWARLVVNRAALDVRGSGHVALWTCRTCAAVIRDSTHAVGRSLVEELIAEAGWPAGWSLDLLHGEGLDTIRGVTYASLVLTARARGKPGPRPNRTPWAHLPSRLVMPDDDPDGVPSSYGTFKTPAT